MAFRDRNQGFGFVYVDIKKLLEQKDIIEQNPETHPQENTAFSVHMPKKAAPSPAPVIVPMPEVKSEARLQQPVDERIKQIKENLDRLQSLHHKLHAVLDELSNVSRNKKKNTPEER